MSLGKFERRPVIRAAVSITNAGDGLSEAMRLAPESLNYDEEVFFVIRGRVSKVTHAANGKDDDGNLVRVHTVRAQEIARVDGAAVKDLLAAEADRVRRLKEDEAGVQRLIEDPLDALSDDASSGPAPAVEHAEA